MNKLHITDPFVLDDGRGCGLRGEVIFGKNRRIIEYTDPFGNKAYRSELDEVLFRESNIVLIGGYQYFFAKAFGLGHDEDTTLRVGDLNEESPQMRIGVSKGNYRSGSYNAETNFDNPGIGTNPGVRMSALDHIFGFLIGDGGAREDNITAIATDYKRRSLFHSYPFRMSNDGTTIDTSKYFGRHQDLNGTISHYIKGFDKPDPHIVHVWVTDSADPDYIDDSVYASTSSIPIESYVEMCMSVDGGDGKGYFSKIGATRRMNEIGLVSGWYNSAENDWECLRLITHFTRPSAILTDNDRLDIIYRLYAR